MEAALNLYSNVLLPERDNSNNIKRLIPLIRDTDLEKKLQTASAKNSSIDSAMLADDAYANMSERRRKRLMQQNERAALNRNNNKEITMLFAAGNNSMISQVVGVIIGSPEFQRK
jgi:hypothetical protein